MKEKTYTVTVYGKRRGDFSITAKGTLKARKEAEKQFEAEYPEDYFDSIESYVVADSLNTP